ncbi:ribonuclease H-like domain-containing protein [Podospora aff. communis PSN243]|uniref:Ribonuclease H-like domain-containing protein n=1 Tax=Podospora aff. communis PSN243 TaxID=3040156 RepID=A0AAV9GZY9_9PEZI|nr:ribonuclease H-like domain-containing protein [Podospora aff. communis PSN243]
MGKMKISGSPSGGGPPVNADKFPIRSAFGNGGRRVTLWTNYFALNVDPKPTWKYSLEVSKHGVDAASEGKGTGAGAAKAGKVAGAAKAPQPEVKSKKRFKIIELALKELLKLQDPNIRLASEFKQQVISSKKLKLPKDNVVVVQLADASRPELWDVKIFEQENGHPDLSALVEYLKTMKDAGNEEQFPKFAAEIDALNVVLSHTTRADPDCASVGSSRFFATNAERIESMPLGESGAQILRGYFQSVRPATRRLLLNANATYGVFRRPGNVGKLLEDFGMARMMEVPFETCEATKDNGIKFFNEDTIKVYDSQLKTLGKNLRHAPLQVKIPKHGNRQEQKVFMTAAGFCTIRDGGDKRNKPIPGEIRPLFHKCKLDNGFDYRNPDGVSFFLKKPEQKSRSDTVPPPPPGLQYDTHVSVRNHFRKKYGFDPNLNLPVINVGKPERPNYVPAELVEIERDQPIKTRLSGTDQRAIISFACRKPQENAQSIMTKARDLLRLNDNPFLKSFGVEVGEGLVTVEGRELSPPTLSHRDHNNDFVDTTPTDGGWRMTGRKVAKQGSRISKWNYLYFVQDPRGSILAFVEFMATKMDIDIDKKPMSPSGIKLGRSGTTVEKAMANLAVAGAQLVIVYLPSKDTATYNNIKELGDCVHGIHTVCVTHKIDPRDNVEGYYTSVGLKVNLKFGGASHVMKKDTTIIGEGKTMVVGYDVTHPTNLGLGAGDNAPSIAALVASVDKDLSQWPGSVWAMRATEEMLDEQLQKHFKKRLVHWRTQAANAKALPGNIIIFRDGVSEGQFKQVLDKELPLIRAACTEMYPPKMQPKITLVVSVKRHQTRFYPTDVEHATKSGSPKEGTVVDRGVTSVRYWDFFLQAHASIQGTARPAHYTVLLDEIFRASYGKKAADALEKLTHDMCYMYGRATRAVSICPPAYYADLLCTRARAHNAGLFEGVDAPGGAAPQKPGATPAKTVPEGSATGGPAPLGSTPQKGPWGSSTPTKVGPSGATLAEAAPEEKKKAIELLRIVHRRLENFMYYV